MKNLKTVRIKNHLTQQELAYRLGISRTALTHYENGSREMDYDLLIKTADLFDISVDYLIDRDSHAALFDDARIVTPKIFDIYRRLPESAQEQLLAFAEIMLKDCKS